MFNTFLLLPFAAYFCILLAIGIISHSKQKNSADFILGSRTLNCWLTAISAHASDMGPWLFMAFPAAIYIGGLSQVWIGFGLLAGMFLNWQLVATKLRIATEKYDSYTLSTFFERRFDDKSGMIRIITGITAVFFLTCYVSAGLIAVGGIFESVFTIDFYIGLTTACVVMLIYTFMGGFITVAWMDLFQAMFLLCMIIMVPVVAYLTLNDGWNTIESHAVANNISLNLLPDHSFTPIMTIIVLLFSWGLGYFGQPHIITKFMGINDPSDMYVAKYIGMTWQVAALAAAVAVGLIAIAYFPSPLPNPELVFVEMTKTLFHPLAAGFVLCGVLAASMSTMDSQILVSASVLSEDFYKHMFKKEASPKELLAVTRIGVLIISAFSLFFAINRNSTILEAVLYAWSGLGCAFGPLVLMSLYYRGANKFGAMAGIFSGGAIAGTWDLVNPYLFDIAIPAMIPGFFISLFSIFFVSRLTSENCSLGFSLRS